MLSYAQIAKRYAMGEKVTELQKEGLHLNTIYRALKREGVPLRHPERSGKMDSLSQGVVQMFLHLDDAQIQGNWDLVSQAKEIADSLMSRWSLS